MTNIFNEQLLNSDGEYVFEKVIPATEVLLEWAVIEGSATVTPGYVNLLGQFTPALSLDGITPSFGASGGTCRVLVPNSGRAALKVADASELSMMVCQNQIPA